MGRNAECGLRNAELSLRDAVKVVQPESIRGWVGHPKRRQFPKERSKRFAFHLRFGRWFRLARFRRFAGVKVSKYLKIRGRTKKSALQPT
jgi:hypothetical protein